MAPSNPNKVN